MTIQPSTKRRRWAALAIVPLALAACGGDDDGTSTGGGADGGGDDGLSIDIASPSDGETVEPGFEMTFDLGVDVGEPDTGLHHVHLYYDGQTEGSPGEDYDLAYEDSFTVERDLGPGEHEIEAVLANADHSLTDASDTINVTVGEGSGGGGSDDGGGTDDSDDGYDY